MKKIVTAFIIIVSLIVTYTILAKEEPSSELFAKKLPAFSLQDPFGNTFTNKSFSKDGLVLVVTAPILKNRSAQKKWSQYLLKAKAGSKAKLVYLEDMQPSFFKGKAMRGMRKDYEFGKEPILLIDSRGEIRSSLKVPQKKTVVLVYDDNGKLIYSETGKPSVEAAEMIWEKVKDSTH
ncbi:MAG: hypothetical protein Q7S98_05445 [Deltaproteobacteria bacterium]|nr:hypothetical protein [Deltaproteobacteria bacterium]